MIDISNLKTNAVAKGESSCKALRIGVAVGNLKLL